MSHPYQALSDANFWRRSISSVERHLIDPVTTVKFHIQPEEKVATAGSCFAQHISKKLESVGFNYFVTERADNLSAEEQKKNNYGVFSARYGNIYTSRQLIQLVEECYEDRDHLDIAWQRDDQRWVDPLRPLITPQGYETREDVVAARATHLDCVRKALEECDVFVFTLGLTEAWRSKRDGTVFPLAPGVSGGNYDPQEHEAINLGVSDVLRDMNAFLDKLKEINPSVKVVLTVSPVPLIATHGKTHVLTANTYSKSVLRVAADELAHGRDWVDYFPSYEIITGNYNFSTYYEDDLRGVNSRGVSHAMRCFERHYIGTGEIASVTSSLSAQAKSAWKDNAGSDIVCDEEEIDRVSN